jgi:hypothetical protein
MQDFVFFSRSVCNDLTMVVALGCVVDEGIVVENRRLQARDGCVLC